MRRAIAFDFDGTVADTMPELRELALMVLMESCGLSRIVADECYMGTVGAPFGKQLERIFPGREYNEGVAAYFNMRKKRRMSEAQPFGDTREAFNLLALHGWTAGVVSSTEAELVRQFMSRHTMDLLVDHVFGNDGGDSKAEQIRFLAIALRILPTDMTLIGDALLDAEYAKKAGVSFLAVETTFGREVFEESGIPSEPSLLSAVRRLIGA